MWWLSAGAVIIVVAVLVLTVIAALPPRFEFSANGLHISQPFFGRDIPASEIRAADARVVDFATSPGLRLKWRTMGLGLPGYKAGWFRLYDGEKALVFLKGSAPPLYIATTAGYAILTNCDNTTALLASLRAMHR